MTSTKPTEIRLVSRRLLIGRFSSACINVEYLGWLNDPLVIRFSNQRFRRHTRESAATYLASFEGTSNHFLALRLRESRRLIGTMTAHVSEPHGTADMGLLIGDRSCWGMGYGLEAWIAVMAHLSLTPSLRKITGGTLRPNLGMIKIMEKSGMHLEAVRTRQEIVEGLEQDVLYFARFLDR